MIQRRAGFTPVRRSRNTMTLDLTVFETEEAAIATDLPASMLFPDGAVVVGMVGDASFGHDLVMEGFTGDSDLEFRGLVSRFTAQPALNSTMTHIETGLKYRILKRAIAPDRLTYVFGLVNLSK